MSTEEPHLARRMGEFLRDFRLENNLQILFPLGSFLLFLGSYYSWISPLHIVHPRVLQLGRPDQWFDFSRAPLRVAYSLLGLTIRFAFYAGVVSWCLPVRDPLRKLKRWTLLPVGLGMVFFLGTVFWLCRSSISVFEPTSQSMLDALHLFSSRLFRLGEGFYLTFLSVLVIATAVAAVYLGRLPLPVRFRGQPHFGETSKSPQLGRSVFTFLIVAIILGTLIPDTVLWALMRRSSKEIPLIYYWPKDFPVSDWLPRIVTALVVAVCAYVFLEKVRKRDTAHLFRCPCGALSAWRRDCLLGTALPLLIIFAPRLLFKFYSEFRFYTGGLNSGGLPPSWSELFLPQPFFCLLLVFVFALPAEIVLRGFLQEVLTPSFGLKRTLLLVSLIWWMLPLGFGVTPRFFSSTSASVRVLGLAHLLSIGIYLAYSASLGWLYARCRSVVPVALMHGTIVLFHEGASWSIYHDHPYFYWLEMAGWVFLGWLLFKKYPPRQIGRAPEAISAG